MEIAQAHSKHQRLERRNREGDIWHKHQWNPNSLWCVRLDKICQLKLTLCHLSNVCAYVCMCVFAMKYLKTNGYATTDLTRRVRFDIPLPSTPTILLSAFKSLSHLQLCVSNVIHGDADYLPCVSGRRLEHGSGASRLCLFLIHEQI